MKRRILGSKNYGAYGLVDIDISMNIEVTVQLETQADVNSNTNSKFLNSSYSAEQRKITYFERFIDKALISHGFEIAESGTPSPNNNSEFYSKYILFYAKGQHNPVFKKICIRGRFSNHKDPTNYKSARYQKYKSETIQRLAKSNSEIQDLVTRRIRIDIDNKQYVTKTYRNAVNNVNKRLDEISSEVDEGNL